MNIFLMYLEHSNALSIINRSLSFFKIKRSRNSCKEINLAPYVKAQEKLNFTCTRVKNALQKIPEYRNYCSFIEEQSFYDSAEDAFNKSSSGEGRYVFELMMIRLVKNFNKLSNKHGFDNNCSFIFELPATAEGIRRDPWVNIESCFRKQLSFDEKIDIRCTKRHCFMNGILGNVPNIIDRIFSDIHGVLLSRAARNHKVNSEGLGKLINAFKKLDLLVGKDVKYSDIKIKEIQGYQGICPDSKKFIEEKCSNQNGKREQLIRSMLCDYLQGMTSLIASLGHLKNFYSVYRDFVIVAGEIRLLNSIFNFVTSTIDDSDDQLISESQTVTFCLETIDYTTIRSVSKEIFDNMSMLSIICINESRLIETKLDIFGNIKSHNAKNVYCVRKFNKEPLSRIVKNLNIALFSLFSYLSGVEMFTTADAIGSMSVEFSDFVVINPAEYKNNNRDGKIYRRIYEQLINYPRLAVISNVDKISETELSNLLTEQYVFSIHRHLIENLPDSQHDFIKLFSLAVIEKINEIDSVNGELSQNTNFGDLFLLINDIRLCNTKYSKDKCSQKGCKTNQRLTLKDGRIFSLDSDKDKIDGLCHCLITLISHVRFLFESETEYSGIECNFFDILKAYLELVSNKDSSAESYQKSVEMLFELSMQLLKQVLSYSVQKISFYSYQDIYYFKQLVNGLSFTYTLIQFTISKDLDQDTLGSFDVMAFENIFNAIFSRLYPLRGNFASDCRQIRSLFLENWPTDVSDMKTSIFKKETLNDKQVLDFLFRSIIKVYIEDEEDTSLLLKIVRSGFSSIDQRKRCGGITDLLNFLLRDSSSQTLEFHFSTNENKVDSYEEFKRKCDKIRDIKNILSKQYVSALNSIATAYLQLNMPALTKLGYMGLFLTPEDRDRFKVYENSPVYIELIRILYLLQSLKFTGLNSEDESLKCDIKTHFGKLAEHTKYYPVIVKQKVKSVFNKINFTEVNISLAIPSFYQVFFETSDLENYKDCKIEDLKEIAEDAEQDYNFCLMLAKEIKSLSIFADFLEQLYADHFKSIVDKAITNKKNIDYVLDWLMVNLFKAMNVLDLKKHMLISRFLDNLALGDRRKFIFEHIESRGWGFVMSQVNAKADDNKDAYTYDAFAKKDVKYLNNPKKITTIEKICECSTQAPEALDLKKINQLVRSTPKSKIVKYLKVGTQS